LHSHLMDEHQSEKTESPSRTTHHCVLVYSIEFGILELNRSTASLNPPLPALPTSPVQHPFGSAAPWQASSCSPPDGSSR
jgi:hypothetical protein